MAYGDSKDLPRRTASDKVLSHEAFNIAKNWKYDGLWFITFFIKGLLVCCFTCPVRDPSYARLTCYQYLKICQAKNKPKNYTKQLLQSSKNVKYTYLLKTIFGVQILHLCQ